ncbi:MAG: hypothetical protein CMJ18_18110 [Phycisphaeraceae bacterium]|nr:hypothetical protein [Phycisphaeraceae bacterium]
MKLSYQAFDPKGREISDVIEADDADDAAEKLRRQGLFVSRIGSTGRDLERPPRTRGRRAGRTRRLKHVAMFARQLHVLVSSGTRLVEGLESLEQQTRDEHWRSVIADVRSRVEEGASLTEAVGQHPEYFDPVCQNLIGAGESTGKMAAMLDRLAALCRKQVQVRHTLAGSMIYPILLVFVSVSVLCSMLLFVLPRFSSLFESLDAPIPPTTQFLMALSYGLRHYWWALLLGIAAVVVGLRYWLRSESGKICFDGIILRTPQVGRMARSFATARIARLLGVLLDSHMPLLEVLGLIRGTMGNVYFARLIGTAEDAVTRGEPVSAAFADSDLISPSVCQVVRSGEQSGQVASLLLNLADLMDEENDVLLKSLMSVIEPLILIGLGLVVGFVTLSMFMPLFDLAGGTGG